MNLPLSLLFLLIFIVYSYGAWPWPDSTNTPSTTDWKEWLKNPKQRGNKNTKTNNRKKALKKSGTVAASFYFPPGRAEVYAETLPLDKIRVDTARMHIINIPKITRDISVKIVLDKEWYLDQLNRACQPEDYTDEAGSATGPSQNDAPEVKFGVDNIQDKMTDDNDPLGLGLGQHKAQSWMDKMTNTTNTTQRPLTTTPREEEGDVEDGHVGDLEENGRVERGFFTDPLELTVARLCQPIAFNLYVSNKKSWRSSTKWTCGTNGNTKNTKKWYKNNKKNSWKKAYEADPGWEDVLSGFEKGLFEDTASIWATLYNKKSKFDPVAVRRDSSVSLTTRKALIPRTVYCRIDIKKTKKKG